MVYNRVMIKSKELKRYNLPEDRILLGVIDAKPNSTLFILFIIGMFLIVIKAYIYGTALISISVLSFLFLPKKEMIEFYDEYLVLYNHANRNVCEMIYYSDVLKWKYNSGVYYDDLEIVLSDESTHTIDGFSKVEYETLLNRFLKDKKDKTKKSRSKSA